MSVSTIGCVDTDKAAPLVLPVTTRRTGGTRLVDAGALQMVINALRRDAEEGKVVRGEMADELMSTVRHVPENALQSALATHPTTQGLDSLDALDAARYRFLRDTYWGDDKELAAVITLQMNKVWDEKIDAAITAQAKQGGE